MPTTQDSLPVSSALPGFRTSEVLQQLEKDDIFLPNPADVSAYLLIHQQLGELLAEICREARLALGHELKLSLEVYKDPEIDDRYLTLYARKEKYEPDYLDRLQAVNDRFSQRLEAVSGNFLLATDFSRPRGTHVV